jgi:DNA-binding transcriptional LysR family regulator
MNVLKSMRSFVTVAELGGFAQASRLLGMSPPAVTRDIATLEQRFGCKLLHRTTRQVRLTEAGTRYFHDARRILSELSEAEAGVIGAHGDLSGPIAVTAPVTFGRLHVGRHIIEFSRRNPKIVFTTLFLDRVVDLLNEGIDVAVRIAQLPDSSMTAISVGSVRRVVCASPSYLDQYGDPKSPSDLERMQVIDFANAQLPWSFSIGGRQKVIRPPARFVVNNVDLAIEAAVAGCGLVSLLSYQATGPLANGRLRKVLTKFEPEPIPVHVVHLEGRAAPRRHRAFIEFLVSELRRDRALMG